MERHYPDWIGAYLNLVEETEPALQYKQWAAISTICACLQRKCWTSWEWDIYPNLYVVLVGPAGARKGSALRPAKKLLTRIGINMTPQSITPERLIDKLAKMQAVCDTDGKAHTSITVFSEEWSVFIKDDRKTMILPYLCNWWDCDDETWTSETKNCGIYNIEGLWVNMLAATVPSFIQEQLPNTAISDGLVSRTIFVYAAGPGKICGGAFKTELDEETETKLAEDLEKIYMLSGEFKFTKAFLNAYLSWYYKDRVNPPFAMDRHLNSFDSRRATHIRKMCMALCASRTDSMIMDVEDFDRAISILKETEKLMPLVFAGRGRIGYAMILEEIRRWLMRDKQVKVSAILKRYIRDLSSEDMGAIVATLGQAGEITSVRESGTSDMIIIWKGDVIG